MKYATQLSCNFQHSHCIFVTIFFKPFARLLFNLAMRIRAFFTKPASIFGLVEQALRRMSFFTEWSGASSFKVILARQSSHFPNWASASGTSGSRCIFHILLRVEDLGEGFGCVDLALSFVSCRELQLSPFEHCPSAFHCQQSPGLLCSACDLRAPHRLTRPAFEAHPGAITFPSEVSSQRRSSNGPIRFPHHLFSVHDHGRQRSDRGAQHTFHPYVGLTVH